MNVRKLHVGCVCVALSAWCSIEPSAVAQDGGGSVPPGGAEDDTTADADEGDGPEAEGGPAAGQDVGAEEGAAFTWTVPRLLIVAERGTPATVSRSLARLLEGVGEQVDPDDFMREARERGLAPTSDAAYEHILPDLSVSLVIEVHLVGSGRARRLRLIYREGRSGLALLEEAHPLEAAGSDASVGRAIIGEARLALAAITLPSGRPREDAPRRGVSSASVAAGTAVRVALGAGLGFGTRSSAVSIPAGLLRLDTSPFPVAAIELRVDVEPRARGRFALWGGMRYFTSVGFRLTEQRADGSLRETPARAQRFEAGAGASWRLAPALAAVTIEGSVGWAWRLFSSEAPVQLPDYALSGPVARGAVSFPIDSGRFVLALAPEVQWIVSVGDALRALGVSSTAVAIGGEARVRWNATSTLAVEASYLESHALLGSRTGSGTSDVERFGALRAIYRP